MKQKKSKLTVTIVKDGLPKEVTVSAELVTACGLKPPVAALSK